jgi:hypothetical protein
MDNKEKRTERMRSIAIGAVGGEEPPIELAVLVAQDWRRTDAPPIALRLVAQGASNRRNRATDCRNRRTGD